MTDRIALEALDYPLQVSQSGLYPAFLDHMTISATTITGMTNVAWPIPTWANAACARALWFGLKKYQSITCVGYIGGHYSAFSARLDISERQCVSAAS